MTEITFPQHGDLPDAAFWAFLGGTPATSCIVSGLGLTPDYATPDVEVGGGKAIIDRGTMDTAHPNIDPPESLEDSVAVAQVDSQTVALDDGATNHLFLQANVASDDSPQVVANTTGDAPSDASVKIGEVDTANDTVSSQWRLVAADGTLTFPDEAAASAAAGELPNGTVVYTRSEEIHWSTIAGSLKRLATWSDPDGDGVYQLPSDTDGIDVGSVSADTLEATDAINTADISTASQGDALKKGASGSDLAFGPVESTPAWEEDGNSPFTASSTTSTTYTFAKSTYDHVIIYADPTNLGFDEMQVNGDTASGNENYDYIRNDDSAARNADFWAIPEPGSRDKINLFRTSGSIRITVEQASAQTQTIVGGFNASFSSPTFDSFTLSSSFGGSNDTKLRVYGLTI